MSRGIFYSDLGFPMLICLCVLPYYVCITFNDVAYARYDIYVDTVGFDDFMAEPLGPRTVRRSTEPYLLYCFIALLLVLSLL